MDHPSEDVGIVKILPGDVMEKQLKGMEFVPLKDHMEKIIPSTDLTFYSGYDCTGYEDVPDLSPDNSESDDEPSGPGASPAKITKPVIGGAEASNLGIIVALEKGIAVMRINPIQGSSAVQAKLLATVPKHEGEVQRPVLLFPKEDAPPPSDKAVERFPENHSTKFSAILDNIPGTNYSGEQTKPVAKADIDDYVLCGDIYDFFSIPGLTAKLFKYKGKELGEKSDDNTEPAREKIKLDTKNVALLGQPLGVLFPWIETEEIKNLPIENLEFTYSEEEQDHVLPLGLYLSADLPLKGRLSWAGDALKKMFGDQQAPDRVYLSAHLGDERNWSQPPKIEKLVLKGYFDDMALKKWDFLEFKTMGVEVSAHHIAAEEGSEEEKEEKDEEDQGESEKTVGDGTKGDGEEERQEEKEKSWKFGFAFFGTLMITKILYADLPAEMNYRIARDYAAAEGGDDDAEEKDGGDEGKAGDEEGNEKEEPQEEAKEGTVAKAPQKELVSKPSSEDNGKNIWSIVVSADNWENFFGIENMTLTKAELKSSFEQGGFKESVGLELSADLELGDATLTVRGEISRDDSFLDAEVGDLTLEQIRKIQAQIAGQKMSDVDKKEAEKKAEGNELTFKKLHLNVSSKKILEKKKRDNSLTLDGEVTLNDHTSATALLKISNDGLLIEGGIEDFDIPDTSIKIQKAGLHVFIAFNSGEGKNKKSNNKQIKEEPEGENAEEKGGDEGEKEDEKEDVQQHSKFAILGVLEIEKISVSVGLYFTKNDEGKRDWIVFGRVSGIGLGGVWPELKNGFLDLELDNVAFIASSEDREEEGETEKGEGEKEEPEEGKSEAENGEEGEGEENEHEDKPANWDVIAQIRSYNYPIVKGVQLCATVRKFDAIEELNRNKPVDGLVLIVAFKAQGQLEVRVKMPETFKVRKMDNGGNLIFSEPVKADRDSQVHLHDYAWLGEFAVALLVHETGPGLELDATLTLDFDDQDLIRVKGSVIGDALGAEGSLIMKDNDTWVNPFKLNKSIVLSKLGVGAGFKYATVLINGPDRLEASGKVQIGNAFTGGMVMSLGLDKNQVFIVDIPKIDIFEIARLAGELTEIESLQHMEGGAGDLVFHDLKFYFSTGAMAFGKFYERGMQVKGNVNFFDKTGDFDGRFNDDGIAIKAGIDNFKIGNLEITSASGGKRATLDVEMTGETQKISIDGRIRYCDLELKMLIDADLQKRHLDADVTIHFTEVLAFELLAQAGVPEDNSLEGVVVHFEAELKVDVFSTIFEGMKEAIGAIGEAATQTIEKAQSDLQNQIDKRQGEVNKMKQELEALKLQSEKELIDRQKKLDAENKEFDKLAEELEKLTKAVKDAEREKGDHDDEVQKIKDKQDEVKREFEDKKREKTEEYNRRIQEQETNQAEWEKKKKELEDQKEAGWGDDLRKIGPTQELVDRLNAEVSDKYNWKEYCWKRYDETSGWNAFEKARYWVEFEAANVALEGVKASRDIQVGILQGLQDIFNSPELRGIENALDDASREIDKFGKALDELTKNGLAGYLEEISRDEKEELDRQIRVIEELEAKSKELESELKRARDELNNNNGRITEEQRTRQSNIEKLTEEIKLKPFEEAYRAKKEQCDKIVQQLKVLQKTLKDIQDGVLDAVRGAQHIIDMFRKGVPRVTRIFVKATNEVLVGDDALVFEVEVEWLDERQTIGVGWKPGVSPSDLYRSVAEKIVNEEHQKNYGLVGQLLSLPYETPHLLEYVQ
ncbi:hypothetical protein FQN54_007071 [Arachnomyces sp. PD_36]|nr:hypothetical protein FQN54_007071 [Arachnomyces sp. PD_36]